MPQIEKPARSIVQVADWDHAKAFKIVCDCTSDEHTVDAWVEIEADDEVDMLEVTFYVKTWTPFFSSFKERVKAAFNVLFRGVHTQEHSLVLKEQGARNWVAAMEQAIKDVESNRDKK